MDTAWRALAIKRFSDFYSAYFVLLDGLATIR